MDLAAPPGPAREFSYFERVVLPGDPCRKFSQHVMFDLTAPEQSSFLLAPLAKGAGGYAACRAFDAGNPNAVPGESVQVFADRGDADYLKLLAGVGWMKAGLNRAKRFDMPGFRPNEHYVREMKRYGILSKAFDPNAEPIDAYATDEAYWRSFWHVPHPSGTVDHGK